MSTSRLSGHDSRAALGTMSLRCPATQSILHTSTQRLQVVFAPDEVIVKAQSGDPAAQADYSLRLLTGNGFEKNKRLGRRWAQMAAEQGNAQGMFLLAGCYYNGEGCYCDIVRAFFWFALAAQHEHREAIIMRKLIIPQLTRAQMKDIASELKAWKPQARKIAEPLSPETKPAETKAAS
jgi:TPR repeat protein